MPTLQMKYKVRAGTIDSGKKYEFKMAALLSLRGVRNEEDMWISSNADGVGAFDDIVFRQGKKTFMLQLKHKDEAKPIQQGEFLKPKGDFALLKYFQDIAKLQQCITSKSKTSTITDYLGEFNNIYFILFTNRDNKSCKFLQQSSDDMRLLKTSVCSKEYKIDLAQLPDDVKLTNMNSFRNIYLFTNQIHAKDIDQQITKEIETIAEHFNFIQVCVKHVAEKFIKYIADWADGNLGGHYCLTKEDVLCKLTDLFLCQYETKLSHENYTFYGDDQKHIWNEVVSNKIITNVDFEKNASVFLFEYIGSEVKKYCEESLHTWTDCLSTQAQNLFYQTHKDLKTHMLKIIGNRGKISLLDIYKCLWMDRKLPLLLEVYKAEQYCDIVHILKLSNYSYKIVIINKSEKRLPAINYEEEIKSFVTLQDLKEQDRSKILQQTIKFQARSVVLENLVDKKIHQHIKCKDIINILLNNFSIGNELNSLPEYFIQRNISEVFIRAEVLNKVPDEIFLIREHFENCFSTLAVENINAQELENTDISNLKECRIIISRTDITVKQINDLKSTQKPVHYLSIHDSHYLEWKASFGSVKNIKKFLIELEDITENNIKNKFYSLANVISASPGMGKSVLMNYVAQQAPTDKWIIRTDLIVHQQYYKRMSAGKELTKAAEHLEYFKNALVNQNQSNIDLDNAVFQRLVETKDIIVLLDGYDEVSPFYKDEVMDMAKSLHREGYSMWITTRPHLKLFLEEEFNTFSITLKPFSANDQKEFLTKYFSTNNTGLNSTALVNEFVEKLLKAAKRNLNERDEEFTGIPLQTKLLADVFNDDCKNYISTNGTSKFNENFDLLYLYQNFVEKKSEIFLEKFGTASQDVCTTLRKHKTFFALKLLFPSYCHLIKDVSRELVDYYINETDKAEALQREGIITFNEGFSINFVHHTFAEYLAAQWLAENLKIGQLTNTAVQLLIKKERFTGNHKFLFNLFDRIVCKNCPLHLTLLNEEREEAITIIKSDPKSVGTVDKCGRTVLHIAALCGFQCQPPFHWEIHEVPENQWILSVIDAVPENQWIFSVIEEIPDNILSDINTDVLGYSPLDYALANRSFIIAEKIIEKLNFLTTPINIHIPLKFKRDFLMYCFWSMCGALFNILLSHFALTDLLLANVDGNMLVKSYLQILLYSEDIEQLGDVVFNLYNLTIFQLFQETNKSNTYSIWKRKMHFSDIRCAVSFGCKSNVHQLLSLGIEVNRQDAVGNTSLHYAVLHRKLANIEILLSNGAELNKQNYDKETPLHIILKNRNIRNRVKLFSFMITLQKDCDKRIIHKLVSKGANINVQDADGNTPLHIALLSQRMDWVEVFVSEGTDVNKQNDNGDTPLLCAVRDQNRNAINLLLSYGADVSIQGKYGKNALHVAAENGWNDILVDILNEHVNIDIQDYGGYTPLIYAARNNNIDMVKIFISKGANSNIQNRYGKTVVHVAAENGYKEIIAIILLTERVDFNKQDSGGNTSLLYTLQNQYLDIAKMLICCGADVSIPNSYGIAPLHVVAQIEGDILTEILSKEVDINKRDMCGSTPLFYAVRNGKRSNVKLLISEGAHVNLRDNNGETVIHVAVKNNYNDILADILLAPDVNSDTENNDGFTPLTYALRDNNKNAIKQLISNNVNVNVQSAYGKNVLHVVVENYWNDLLINVLSKHVSIDKQDKDGDTPLMYALYNSNVDAAKQLISKGANLNIQNKYNQNVFHIAVQENCIDILKELLFKNVDIEKKDNFGYTPLLYAIRSYNTYAIELLIANGANLGVQSRHGRNALHLLAERGYKDILNKMSFQEVDIDQQDNYGNTPLVYAVRSNEKNTVRLLISKGANANISNSYGKTPLHIAATVGNCDILCEIICTNGININKKDNYGNTPLSYAVCENRKDIIRVLVYNGADVNIPNNNGKTPLHVATESKNDDILNEILFEKVDAREQSDLYSVSNKKGENTKIFIYKGERVIVQNNDEETAIYEELYNHSQIEDYHECYEMLCENVDVDEKNNNGYATSSNAVHSNNKDTVKLSLLEDEKLNMEGEYGKNILYIASENGWNEIDILSQGGDIDKQDNYGDTPLLRAIRSNKENTAKLLISKGGNVTIQNGQGKNALHLLAEKGNYSILSEIVFKGLDINKKDNYGNTPIFYAVHGNKTDIVQLLISNGATVDTQNNYGETILHIAAASGFADIVTEILSRKVNIDAEDEFCNTPLLYSIRNNRLHIARLLISKGANPSISNNYEETALRIAAETGCVNILEELLSTNVDLDKQDSNGNTLLLYALNNKQRDIAKLLISKGANPNLSNHYTKENALHMTCKYGYNDILSQILSKEVEIDKQDNYGRTALFYAASNNDIDAVKLLTSSNSNIYVKNKKGTTVLDVARRRGFHGILNVLLETVDSNRE